MSEFRPLQEQKAEKLFEKPLLNLQLDSDFDASRFSEMRHAIIDFLRTDRKLQSCVGCPIPDSLIDNVELSLAELLANAQRPEADRHATGVYVWAKEHQIGVGVGDDSDTIAGEDQRPQTKVLPPVLGARALDAYNEDFSVELTSGDELQSSGFGGSILSILADHVSYIKVSADQADHPTEPRTHKVVRADFDIPFGSDLDQAA